MRHVLLCFLSPILLNCTNSIQEIKPCISNICLTQSIDGFASAMNANKLDYNAETSPLFNKLKLTEPVSINEKEYSVEFLEPNSKTAVQKTQLLMTRKLKDVSTAQCEADFNEILEYLSLRFGSFVPFETTLPDDYTSKITNSSVGAKYRRIQSSRGQLTFQAKLKDTNLSYELELISPIFTSNGDVTDCNILFLFQTK